MGGFTLKDIKNNDAIKKIMEKKLPEQVKSLSQVSDIEARDFGKGLMKIGVYSGWKTGRRGDARSCERSDERVWNIY